MESRNDEPRWDKGCATRPTPGPGVTLTYAYNIAARVSGITSSLNDGNHPGTLVSGVQYNPAGGHLAASLGNGVNETLAYDQRLRLQSLTAVKDTTTVYSFSIAAYAPNSNVLTGNDNVNGNWTYGYDDFNRLTSASKTGESYTYAYDRFGNRWQQNGPHQLSLGFDANNRIVGGGVTYDAAGNVTYDGQTSYTYDAENRIISTSGTLGSATYVYNAAGMRVRKTTGGTSVDYLYDLAGAAVAELNTSGAWTRIEVYAGSRHVATYKDGPSGQTYFAHGDWLGTERARTDKNGAVTETCTNLPFGDWQACAGTSVSPLHFTGKQRDAETDNDYFGARYYVSRHGRWLTPDWSARAEAVPYASLANPQTLNLYAYVGNNPTTTTDADGHVGTSETKLVSFRKGGEIFFKSVDVGLGTLPGGDTADGLEEYVIFWFGTLTSETEVLAELNASADPQQAEEKYDPTKTGPEDPTNPGKPLYQNKEVRKEMDKLFMMTTNGTARGSLAEAGVAVEFKDGKISFGKEVSTVHSDGAPNKLDIPTSQHTIAIIHTHGNKALPTPSMPTKTSPGDVGSRVPNFVRSQSALYVTVPGTNKFIRLEPPPKGVSP